MRSGPSVVRTARACSSFRRPRISRWVCSRRSWSGRQAASSTSGGGSSDRSGGGTYSPGSGGPVSPMSSSGSVGSPSGSVTDRFYRWPFASRFAPDRRSGAAGQVGVVVGGVGGVVGGGGGAGGSDGGAGGSD